MSAVANPVGLKRICTSCGSRFYDLNKRPIMCPECDTEFTGEIKAKGRRSRTAPEPKKAAQVKEKPVNENEDEDILDEEDDLEVVSLEDIEDIDDDEDDDTTINLDDDEDDDLSDIPDLDDDLDADLDDDDAILEDDED